MLANAVQRFANDLQTISDTIRTRTVGQIKGALQKKAFEEAGIVVQQQQPQPVQVRALIVLWELFSPFFKLTLRYLLSYSCTVDSEASIVDVYFRFNNQPRLITPKCRPNKTPVLH